MKVSLLVAAAFAAVAMLASPVAARQSRHHVSKPIVSESEKQAQFIDFVRAYNKTYTADEFLSKYNIFGGHLDTITQHNAEAAKGVHSWTMAINEFADLTWEEFEKGYTGYKPMDEIDALSKRPTMEEWVPEWGTFNASADPGWVDLRQRGQVTGVKNQGGCGGCWAFSAVASMESAHKIHYGPLRSLSEQQLIDCAPSSLGCNGCNGGQMQGAFQWVLDHGGITGEEHYAYSGSKGGCRGVGNDASFHNYVRIPANEWAISGGVAWAGVISVGISASGDFQHYSAGIYDGSCGMGVNHGVAIVGYGHDNPSNKDYFLVKNSWGSGWGAGGYIYMRRNVNKCNINSDASYMSFN